MSRMPKNPASDVRNQAAANMWLNTDRNQITRVNKRSDRAYQRYNVDREQQDTTRYAREPRDQDFQLTGRIPKQEFLNTQRFSPREMEMELRKYEAWRTQQMSDSRRVEDTRRAGNTQRMGGAQRMENTQRMGNAQRMGSTLNGASRQTGMNPAMSTARGQAARGELQANRLSRVMMYMTCLLLMVLMFVQIGRLAQIAAQTKRIVAINGSIREMDIERNNLEVRLNMQQDVNNVKKAAMNRLGMVYPEDSQIRVIALGQSDPSRTQTADNSGALEGMN